MKARCKCEPSHSRVFTPLITELLAMEHKKALTHLKKALINAHVLKYSDPSKQPIIQTDVPEDRGACLLQKAQSVTHAALTDTEKDNDVF